MSEPVVNKLKRVSDEYNRLLRLSGYPVAVKLFKTSGELENLEKTFNYIRRVDKKLALCQPICQAHYLGRVRSGTVKELGMCPMGAASMGLMDVPKEFREGKFYKGMYHLTDEIGKKSIQEVPKFTPGEHQAVLISPLERCPIDPDTVMFFGNAAQILMFVGGYLYDKGGRLNFSSSAQFACADAIVTSIKTGKPSVVLPCNGIRLWGGLSSETDLICGVPGSLLGSVLEGIKFLHKGGVRYPPAWQHIDMELRLVFPLWQYTKEY